MCNVKCVTCNALIHYTSRSLFTETNAGHHTLHNKSGAPLLAVHDHRETLP